VLMGQSAEYALRAVVWLASQGEVTVGTAEIARHTHVPPGYMSKVLQALARAGLVESTPGRAGGFRLRRSADRISVLEVVNVVDSIERIRRCPLGLKSHRHVLCPLHRRLDEVAEIVERAYGETTIAEIVAETTPVKALCESG
jgi:Rrf2 family nitric oxide-sensitive transcriptional repressor